MFEHLVSFKFKEKLGPQKEMELIESLITQLNNKDHQEEYE